MRIKYKDIEIETKSNEKLPPEFKPILNKILEIIEEIKDQIHRGIINLI